MAFIDKTPQMQAFLNDTAKQTFGRTVTEAFNSNICVVCGEAIEEFTDELERKEYHISGIGSACGCQAKLFSN